MKIKDPYEGWINEYWIAYEFSELKTNYEHGGPLSSAIIRTNMLISYINNHEGPDLFKEQWNERLAEELRGFKGRYNTSDWRANP